MQSTISLPSGVGLKTQVWIFPHLFSFHFVSLPYLQLYREFQHLLGLHRIYIVDVVYIKLLCQDQGYSGKDHLWIEKMTGATVAWLAWD